MGLKYNKVRSTIWSRNSRDSVFMPEVPGIRGFISNYQYSSNYKKDGIQIYNPHKNNYQFLCPQRNFGRHIVIALSVRPASCPVHISFFL